MHVGKHQHSRSAHQSAHNRCLNSPILHRYLPLRQKRQRRETASECLELSVMERSYLGIIAFECQNTTAKWAVEQSRPVGGEEK